MENPVVFNIGPVPVTQALFATWCMTAVVLAAAGVLRLRLRAENPCWAQRIVEMILDWLGDEIEAIVNRDARPFIPLIASLFLFIFVSNLSSLVSPLIPGFTPPTSDITATAALATVVFLAVPLYGVTMSGPIRYMKTYIEPTVVMLPMNVISELSRTLALAVRLFGNIFSGEILFMVILSLIPYVVNEAVVLTVVPLAFQFFIMFLSLITGAIQAYIFAILATVYIGGAVKTGERKKEEEAAQ